MSTAELAWTKGMGGYLTPSNPQTRLHVPSNQDVRLSMKMTTSGGALIVAIFRGSNYMNDVVKDAAVTKSKYLTSDSVTFTANLAAGDYIVLCCRGKASPEEATGTLQASVGSLVPLKVQGKTVSHKLTMEGEGAAGYGNTKNPQFFITVKKKTVLRITFKVDPYVAGEALCFFVTKTPKPAGNRIDEFGNEASRVCTSSFLSASSVTKATDAVEPGVYAVLVMKNKKTECSCELDVLAVDDENVSVTGSVYERVSFTLKSCDAMVKDGVETASVGPAKFPVYPVAKAKAIVDRVNSTLGNQECFADSAFGRKEKHINGLSDADAKMLKAQTWTRPAELVSDPVLFADGASAEDIAQGSLGNCWFCAAISALAGMRQDVVTRMFYPAKYNPKGIYAVQLYIQGEWKAMIIDDALPSDGSGLAFARSADRSEFWFSFVEKVFAKVVGSYQQLMGRHVTKFGGAVTVLPMCTGAPAERVPTKSVNDWWSIVQECTAKKWLLTTGSRDGADRDATGVVAAHAYSVLGSVDVEKGKFRLLKMRNTWGRTEWKGDWSDGSDLWRKHLQVAKACGVDPNAKDDDGIFWISADDFQKNFEGFNLCKFVDAEFPFNKTVDGAWTADSCDKKRSNVAECQQFFLSFKKPGVEMRVTLMHRDAGAKSALRAFVFAAPKDSPASNPAPLVTVADTALFQSRYVSSQSVSFEVSLPSDVTQVVLVPLCPGAPTANFRFIIHASQEFTSTRPAQLQKKTVDHGWQGASVCGYKKKECPKVRLTVKKPCAVELSIELAPDTAKQGLQFSVASGEPGATWPSAVVCETKFVSSLSIALTTPELEPGVYTVWCTRQKPEAASFKFTAACAHPITLDKV